MDANGREKIGMLMRLLETIHREVSRILSEEEDDPARSAVPKETETEISKGARHNLEDACSAIENALDLMQLVIADASQ